MNDLIAMSSEMTMGTREIAEMLGTRHADIIKSVCRLHDAGAICHDTTLPFREFKTERGNTYIEYMLNKLDSITLVAQNSPQFTAALVKAGMAEHGDSSHAYSQAKFTPKGVEWLAGELAKHEAKKLMEVE